MLVRELTYCGEMEEEEEEEEKGEKEEKIKDTEKDKYETEYVTYICFEIKIESAHKF